MTHDNTQSDVVEALEREIERCTNSGPAAALDEVRIPLHHAAYIRRALTSLSTKDSDAVLKERERCALLVKAMISPGSVNRSACIRAIRKGDNA